MFSWFYCFGNYFKYLFCVVLCRYPNTDEDYIAEACPLCHGNCNYKACLRLDVPVRVSFSFSYISWINGIPFNVLSLCMRSLTNIYVLLQNLKNLELDISEHEIFKHYKYVLQILLPFLQQLNEEQMAEKQLEAERQGIFY